MMSRIFTFGLLAASVYFFYEHNYIVGVLLLVGALFRLPGHNLQQFARRLGNMCGARLLCGMGASAI